MGVDRECDQHHTQGGAHLHRAPLRLAPDRSHLLAVAARSQAGDSLPRLALVADHLPPLQVWSARLRVAPRPPRAPRALRRALRARPHRRRQPQDGGVAARPRPRLPPAARDAGHVAARLLCLVVGGHRARDAAVGRAYRRARQPARHARRRHALPRAATRELELLRRAAVRRGLRLQRARAATGARGLHVAPRAAVGAARPGAGARHRHGPRPVRARGVARLAAQRVGHRDARLPAPLPRAARGRARRRAAGVRRVECGRALARVRGAAGGRAALPLRLFRPAPPPQRQPHPGGEVRGGRRGVRGAAQRRRRHQRRSERHHSQPTAAALQATCLRGSRA
mmetsp:Transcript_65364/g.172424  ORF Transcript_65364/g.172424 Transcript_65364/m.172424 type:complete len:340 (+) Transcript_65364:779-1798(+)